MYIAVNQFWYVHVHVSINYNMLFRLTTLEVANEKISSLNQISERNYFTQSEEFGRNIRLLGNMKKELDSVFRRIR